MNDGGPAFPTREWHVQDLGGGEKNEYESTVPGMTLRDWFAGMACIGILAQVPPEAVQSMGPEVGLDRLGVAAYRAADSMLKERQK